MTDPVEESMAAAHAVETQPLSVKVLLALSLALFPLGLLAAALSISSFDDARRESMVSIERRAEALAGEVDEVLQNEGLVLRALALRLDDEVDEEECAELLTPVARMGPLFASLTRIDEDGRTLCRSDTLPRLSAAEAQRAARLRLTLNGSGSNNLFFDERRENVLFAARSPAADGESDSIVAVMPIERLQERLKTVTRPVGSQLSVQVADVNRRPLAGTAVVASDAGRYGVLTPTRVGGLKVRYEEPLASFGARRIAAIAAPPLMWAAALVIAWLTLQRLVVKPLALMQHGIEKRAAGGDATPLTPLVGDTAEFVAFAHSYDTLSAKQREDRKRREDALAKQQRLVREVHHRVKNNLQIITSLLSIKGRDTRIEGERRAYGMIQMRVEALALVHRWLHADNAIRGVDLAALMHDLLAGLEGSLDTVLGVEAHFSTRLKRLFVSQDSAVPLAFLVTELIAGEAAAVEENASLKADVVLEEAGEDEGYLSIAGDNLSGAQLSGEQKATASARIIQGMTRQLRGDLSFDKEKNAYQLRFPLGS